MQSIRQRLYIYESMCKSSSVTTSWRPEQPYNDLPAVPSPELLETNRVLKEAIDARVALAQLDEAASAIPNPAVLINAIPTLEARASSEIENIVTTTDALFRLAADVASADPSTKEALRYRTALRVGFEQVEARGLTVAVAVAVCTLIKGHTMEVRAVPGTRIGNPATGEITYSPPEGRDTINAKLADWERFLHADDGLDPLVRMAAAHYQFEAIHPFADGNGRTGRILNVLMLTEAGLLRSPLLYLSRYFIETRSEYYRLLRDVTAIGAWEAWIVYVLRGVAESSRQSTRKIAEIRTLQDEFGAAARQHSHGGSNTELMSLLFEQPYCRIGMVIDRCEVSRPTATKWLHELVDARLLSELKVGRDRLFINTQFVELLSRW